MQKYNYSIIIPHYNIPELLIRCLNSIPERDDVQVIVVDDCSPNAYRYKEQYPSIFNRRAEFYSTTKGGSAGRARNIGVEHAKGNWLVFLDADDLLPKDISETFDDMKDRKEDAIYMNYKSVLSNDLNQISSRNPKIQRLIANYEQTKDEDSVRYEHDPLWGMFIKKALVERNHIRFDETRWSNDSYFALCVGISAKEVLIDNRTAYILTERQGSLANDFCHTPQEITTRISVALRMKDLLKKNRISQKHSTLYFFDDLLKHQFSRSQRIGIALNLWKHPRYMLHVFCSCI